MLFSRARKAEREAAERIYMAALAAARRPYFYLECGVPDTLQGRFEMVALNVFPVLHRLTHEPGDDPALAQRVAECLVDDMDDALRGVGISDTRVPKRMKTLYGSFAGRMAAYGTALGEGGEALPQAIARNIFPEGGADVHVRSLADYLARAVEAMKAEDLGTVRAGRLAFPEPASTEQGG